MLADVIRGAGYTVLDLGPDTPVASLVAAIAKVEQLSAVCVSVVFDEVVGAAAEMIAAVKETVGPEVPVIVGGRAIRNADHALSMGADAWATDPNDAIQLIESFDPPTTAGAGAVGS
jgi:methanogenic corrinoid protein MtbC1